MTEEQKAEAVPINWPRRILFVVVMCTVLFFLLRSCLQIIAPNGGHMFDTYDVISILPSSDGKVSAVEYEYDYAELSAEGQSVWLVEGKAPEIGSKGIASGEPAFTFVSPQKDISWVWNTEGKLEVRISGSVDLVTTNSPSGCFWDYSGPKFCLHSNNVIVKK